MLHKKVFLNIQLSQPGSVSTRSRWSGIFIIVSSRIFWWKNFI